MDRGAWQALVHRVAKSWIGLKQLSMHTCIFSFIVVFYFLFLCALFYSIKKYLNAGCNPVEGFHNPKTNLDSYFEKEKKEKKIALDIAPAHSVSKLY